MTDQPTWTPERIDVSSYAWFGIVWQFRLGDGDWTEGLLVDIAKGKRAAISARKAARECAEDAKRWCGGRASVDRWQRWTIVPIQVKVNR